MDYFKKETKRINSIRGKLIRFFGLKGSWSWAKKQLLKGEIVRCKHWSGALKYRVTDQGMIEMHFGRTENHSKWERANHFLSYKNFIDYEVFKWD